MWHDTLPTKSREGEVPAAHCLLASTYCPDLTISAHTALSIAGVLQSRGVLGILTFTVQVGETDVQADVNLSPAVLVRVIDVQLIHTAGDTCGSLDETGDSSWLQGTARDTSLGDRGSDDLDSQLGEAWACPGSGELGSHLHMWL